MIAFVSRCRRVERGRGYVVSESCGCVTHYCFLVVSRSYWGPMTSEGESLLLYCTLFFLAARAPTFSLSGWNDFCSPTQYSDCTKDISPQNRDFSWLRRFLYNLRMISHGE